MHQSIESSLREIINGQTNCANAAIKLANLCKKIVGERYPLLMGDDIASFNKSLLELSDFGHYHSGPGAYYGRGSGDDDMSFGAMQRRAQERQQREKEGVSYQKGGIIPRLRAMGEDIMVTEVISLEEFMGLRDSLTAAIEKLDSYYAHITSAQEVKGAASEAEEMTKSFKKP